MEIRCREILAAASEQEVSDLYLQVATERMYRKYNDVYRAYELCMNDWNQTCYRLLLRMMDIGSNKEAYTKLSETITYRHIMREAHSLPNLEALLLCGSGLLYRYAEDDYTVDIKERWNHLANKYRLSSMRMTDWDLTTIRPYNHPVLRISQLANLLHHEEFIVNRTVACNSAKDIEELFCVEASEYWSNHAFAQGVNLDFPKRIGKAKSHLLGINLVVPMRAAYLQSIGSGPKDIHAENMELLRQIPAEDNRYTRQWQHIGSKPKNALESQAIIQITTEYCLRGRCAECPLMAIGR
ncbi:MAG: DUF2851 family protein [Alistipes sp.]|nr:DUF2851 family protein [Alistipes sp.]